MRFCKWKSNDYNEIMIFLSLKNACNFLFAKAKTWKSIFNTDSELLQNCTEKQTTPLKTTVICLFNDIWCYFSHWLFWLKNWRFSTVVRVYYILNWMEPCSPVLFLHSFPFQNSLPSPFSLARNKRYRHSFESRAY